MTPAPAPRRADRVRDATGVTNGCRLAFVCLGLAGLVFGMGVLAAWSIGFVSVYVHTRAAYAGAFSVAWAFFWYIWSVQHVPVWLSDAREAAVGGPEWSRFERDWRRRLEHVPVKSSVVVAGLLALYYGLATGIANHLWVLPTFSPAWSNGPDLVVKNLILDEWAVAMAFAIVPNVVGALTFAVLVHRLGTVSFLPSVTAVREAVRPLSFFGLVTGFAWSGATVAVVAILGPHAFGWAAVGLVAAGAAVGLQLIFWPQFAVHRLLVRVQQQARRPYVARIRHARAGAAEEDALRAVAADRTWVHAAGLAGVLVLLAQVVLPVASLILGLVFRARYT